MTKINLKLNMDNQIQAQYTNFWLIKVWMQSWDVKFIVFSLTEDLSYVKQQHMIIPGTTPSHVPPRLKPWRTQLWAHCVLLTHFPFWHFVPGRSKSCANPVFTTNILKMEKKLYICLHQNKLLFWYVDLIMEL